MNIKTLLWTYIVKPIKNLGGDKGKIRRQWKQIMGYDLDLSNPRTFNEKIQYLKLLERKPEYTVMVDKYAAKQWIADRVGEEYVPKLLGVWNRAEDIDFDALPQRFVLKTTHDSGGVIVVKDKSDLDKGKALDKHNLAFDRQGVIDFLNDHLHTSHYKYCREWVYKNVPPRIIAEEFLDPNQESERSPDDFRLFCFNGEPRIAYIDKTWFDGRHVTHYSFPDWKKLHIVKKDCIVDKVAEPRPENLDEMLDIARKLSKGLPFLRVDLFLSNGRIFVGEVTFFPVGGYEEYETEDTQMMMGNMIDLSAWREYGGGIYLYIKKLRSVLGLKGI